MSQTIAATVTLLALLLLPSMVAAQVSGNVMGEDNQPLEAVAVQLLDESTRRLFGSTITTAEGRYELSGIPEGRYEIVFSFLGYTTHRQSITVGPESFTLDVSLSSRALESPSVLVSMRRARAQLTPLTHSNITSRDLETLPAMRDLPANLRQSPSMTYYSENGNDLGYTYLQMRGFGQRRIAVAINGVPQNDPEEHNVFWINFYDLQGSIKDIQLQRGAGSAFYGSTGIGGAINIVTSPYEAEPYARFEGGYGAFNTQRYTIQANTGLIGGRYVAYGRVSRVQSDGYRDWSWSDFWRFFGGIVRYGERHTWTLQAYGGRQNDGLAYVGIPKEANTTTVTDDFGTTIDRRYNFSEATQDEEWFHQPHAELIHQWQVRPRMQFNQTFFWVAGVGHFDFGGTFRSADYLRLPADWEGLSAEERTLPLFITAPSAQVLFRAALDQYQVGWLPRMTWIRSSAETTLGLEARLHRSLRWGRVEEATGLPAEVVGEGNDYRVYSFRGEKRIASAFASHLARVNQRLALQGDVQLTWRRYKTHDEAFFGTEFEVPYLFVNPRLGVTINPEQAISGYASVAFASREPRMKTLYDGEEAGGGAMPQFYQGSNGSFIYDRPLVKPERLVDVEAGMQVTKPSWRLAMNGYFMQFTDEIVPSGGLDQFGVPRTGNADKTRHLGLELEGAARLTPGLDVFGNATLSRSRFLEFVEYATPEGLDRSGNPIAGFPSQVANLGVTYRWKGLQARVDLNYTGERYVDNGGGEGPDGTQDPNYIMDAFTLINASVRYGFAESSLLGGLEVCVDINNVLNNEVLLYGNAGFGAPQFFPAATGHLFGGVRYTL